VRHAGHDRALASELEMRGELLRSRAARACGTRPDWARRGGDEREDRDHGEDLDQREASLTVAGSLRAAARVIA